MNAQVDHLNHPSRGRNSHHGLSQIRVDRSQVALNYIVGDRVQVALDYIVGDRVQVVLTYIVVDLTHADKYSFTIRINRRCVRLPKRYAFST